MESLCIFQMSAVFKATSGTAFAASARDLPSRLCTCTSRTDFASSNCARKPWRLKLCVLNLCMIPAFTSQRNIHHTGPVARILLSGIGKEGVQHQSSSWVFPKCMVYCGHTPRGSAILMFSSDVFMLRKPKSDNSFPSAWGVSPCTPSLKYFPRPGFFDQRPFGQEALTLGAQGGLGVKLLSPLVRSSSASPCHSQLFR